MKSLAGWNGPALLTFQNGPPLYRNGTRTSDPGLLSYEIIALTFRLVILPGENSSDTIRHEPLTRGDYVSRSKLGTSRTVLGASTYRNRTPTLWNEGSPNRNGTSVYRNGSRTFRLRPSTLRNGPWPLKHVGLIGGNHAFRYKHRGFHFRIARRNEA